MNHFFGIESSPQTNKTNVENLMFLDILMTDYSFFYFQGTPTVLPAQDFDAKADVAKVRKAMKGFGCDEDSLIEVICRRNNQQRMVSVM